jgi:hypothetical protein
VPIDGLMLAKRCNTAVKFACSTVSTATSLADQELFAAVAPRASAVALAGTSHFPGSPPSSSVVLANALAEFAHSLRG